MLQALVPWRRADTGEIFQACIKLVGHGGPIGWSGQAAPYRPPAGVFMFCLDQFSELFLFSKTEIPEGTRVTRLSDNYITTTKADPYRALRYPEQYATDPGYLDLP